MQSAEETKLRWHASVHDHVLALALSKSLLDAKRFTEAKSLLRERLSEARRALGAEADVVLHLHWNYAATLYSDDGASRDDVIEALAILEGHQRHRSGYTVLRTLSQPTSSRTLRPHDQSSRRFRRPLGEPAQQTQRPNPLDLLITLPRTELTQFPPYAIIAPPAPPRPWTRRPRSPTE